MRRLCALAACLLLAAGLAAQWAHARRGYADVVYYERSRLVTGRSVAAASGGIMETWIDPRQRRFREDWHGWAAGAPAGRVYITANTMVVEAAGYATWSTLLPPTEQRRIGQLEAILDRGGLAALGSFFLQSAFGPVTRTRLNGRPALTFTTFAHPIHSPSGEWTMWLDAASLAPLQYQLAIDQQVIDTLPVERAARLASRSLPSGFFDPPRTAPSLWDRLSRWARALARS